MTSGSSLCPPVLLRLAEVLHDAGHFVVRPGCAHCGKVRSDLRHFLKWTTSRRLTRELIIPSIPRQDPQDLLDDDDRWRLLQRCLTDDSMPIDVRAAGAITLLFGPSTERLCHLTPEHLDLGD